MSGVSGLGSPRIPEHEPRKIQKELAEIDKAEARLFKKIVAGKKETARLDITSIRDKVSHLEKSSDKLTEKQKIQLAYLKTRLARIASMIESTAETKKPRPAISNFKQYLRSFFEDFKERNRLKREDMSASLADLKIRQLIGKISDTSPASTYFQAIVPLEIAMKRYPDSPKMPEWQKTLSDLETKVKDTLRQAITTDKPANAEYLQKDFTALYGELIKLRLIATELRTCIETLDPTQAKQLIDVMGLNDLEEALATLVDSSSNLQLTYQTMLVNPAATLADAESHFQKLKAPTTIDLDNFRKCTKQAAYTFRMLPLLTEVNTSHLTNEQIASLRKMAHIATRESHTAIGRKTTKELINDTFKSPNLQMRFIYFGTRIPEMLEKIGKNSPKTAQENCVELLYQSKYLAEQLRMTA